MTKGNTELPHMRLELYTMDGHAVLECSASRSKECKKGIEFLAERVQRMKATPK